MHNLDADYFKYWGKADKNDPDRYHLLPYHCLDVAAVGSLFLESHHLLCSRLSNTLNMNNKNLIKMFRFFLSVHDIGKYADVFQNKRPDIKEKLSGIKSERQSMLRHDSLGYIVWKHLWERMLQERLIGLNQQGPMNWELQTCIDQLACCFTGHHGLPGSAIDGSRRLRSQSYFTDLDIEAVYQFIKDQWLFHNPDKSLLVEEVTDEDVVKKASWWISGLTVVCDWIGSDESIFTYIKDPMRFEDYWHKIALPRAQKTLSKCGLLPSHSHTPLKLSDLMGENLDPTPLQVLCGKNTVPVTPQLWILEDITGSGKTEAAMLLVNRLMASGQADGFFIGLPTMATADAMYVRMAECYRRLFCPDQHPSLILAHGSRHLSTAFRQSILPIGSGSDTYGGEEPTGSAECAAWLADNRKKALLADAGVGTIDQALLSILPCRHQSLRLIGLGTKILVVDEVHAYDSYMHSLLKTLLTFQAHFEGSVILLSATLPQKTRKDLIEAYREGLGAKTDVVEYVASYPLVTTTSAETIDQIPVKASKRSIRSIPVNLVHDENKAIDILDAAVNRGQCACWIRNTVFDARQAYEQLLQRDGVASSDVILFHARFTLADRLRIEREVTKTFGKKSIGAKRSGKILIATQVVEQSLDLDFDVMISDLAPIDLIIQRAGRLHRHFRDERGDPIDGPGQKDLRPIPVFHVLSPEPVDTPPTNWYKEIFPKAACVYPHVGRLWLTSRILKQKGEIRMPGDLRDLIEGVYSESAEEIPQALAEASYGAEGQAIADAGLGKYNVLRFENGYQISSGQWSEEINVPTRLGDETQSIYLARLDGGKLVPFENGRFPWDLSSIRVSKRKLNNLSPEIEEKYRSQLETLTECEKRISKYAVVLPMFEKKKNGWVSQGTDAKENVVDLRYDNSVGLLVGDEVGAAKSTAP
jgi:CRISPR-associated endonuclease/helicase Cas3